MIKEEFLTCVAKYTSDHQQVLKLWHEVEKHYAASRRFYHNLQHLENLTSELLPLKEKFQHWDVVIFSIVYHDIVYNTLKSDNEEKSAEVAVKRLNTINVPSSIIDSCKEFILATKMHGVHSEEINFFTDADLRILGSPSEAYAIYAAQIRREYSLYPDLVYNPGRKKVLTHFLHMATIFKTQFFQNRYEAQARINIQTERDQL